MKGGKRTGAGRPNIAHELKKKPVNLKIPNWLNDWLDEQPESKISLIEKALMAQYQLTTPYVSPDWFEGLSERNKDGLNRLALYSLPKVKKLVNDISYSFPTESNMGSKSKEEIKDHLIMLESQPSTLKPENVISNLVAVITEKK
jgi:hypothetical protein